MCPKSHISTSTMVDIGFEAFLAHFRSQAPKRSPNEIYQVLKQREGQTDVLIARRVWMSLYPLNLEESSGCMYRTGYKGE